MAMQKVAINGPTYDFNVKLCRVFITRKGKKKVISNRLSGGHWSFVIGVVVIWSEYILLKFFVVILFMVWNFFEP